MESNERMSPTKIIGLTILGVAVLLLLCWGSFTLMARFAPTADIANVSATVRDLLLILLAIESLAVGIFMLLMLWQLYQLVKLLRDEVVPLLNTTKETVEQVKHTTTFVGQSVSAPLISAAGLVAGVKEIGDTLRGKKRPTELIIRETERLQERQREEEGHA
ncbi:MAG: hypothetical protein KDD73_16715 [Anaerolineales bacterium]|nr:hypothetical protein [Anaerolineales bacterium]MCB9127543.1 hypothetical protein [Ardenticatenales bacterium]